MTATAWPIVGRGRPRRPAILAVAVALLGLLAAAPAARATDIQRVVSPGGIEAWLVRDTTVPIVAMEYAFAGGSSQDPAGKPGVAHMVSGLLDEGAGDLDARVFQERMEAQAIELRFQADRDHFRGSLRTLAERRDEAFGLLRLALTAPRFDPDAVERVRTQVAVGLQRDTTNPNALVSRAWWAAAFPGHPYGSPPTGTLDSIQQISADDLRGYAHRVLARDTLKIGIVGDITAADAGTMLDRVFGALPAQAELSPVPDAAPQGLGSRLVVPLDTPQAVVSLGTLGLARKDPDFIPAYVANHIFGGGSFTSRLYTEVREKRGLAYGVSTSLAPMRHTALLMGYTATSAEQTGEALDIILREFHQFSETGPTQEELDKAKAFLKGSFPLRFDTSTKIAAQLVQIQIEDLGIDYIERRNALIDAVTLDDVKRVSAKLFGQDLLVAIVGRPKGVAATGPGPRG